MDREETAKIMSLFRAAYPKFYDGKGKKELEGIVTLWNEMFAEEPYVVVANAVKAFISTDTKGFPPVIGQVKEKVRALTHPDEMTASEAWSYVTKAIKNSAYNSKEEFEKLPDSVRAVVNNPDQLREWAGMETETVQSVVSSNFQRSFQRKANQEREWQALPENVKEFHRQIVAKIVKPMPELPDADETKLIAARDDKVAKAKTAFDIQKMLEEAITKDFKIPEDKEPTEEEKQDFEERKRQMLDKLKNME